MHSVSKYEIGIVDTRRVVQTIHDLFGFDLKDFSLTSLKRRLDHVIAVFNLSDAEGLIQILKSETLFFEEFLREYLVEDTELFRDPSLWRILRDSIIPGLLGCNGTLKILLPAVSSGEELVSLAILLRENGWEKDAQVYASAFSGSIIKQVRQGVFDMKKFEVSDSNYQKLPGKSELSKYLKISGTSGSWDNSLTERVQFIRHSHAFETIPRGMRLILFRNKLIYFSPGLEDRALGVLFQSLMPGGYLITGNKETISRATIDYGFHLVDKSESIYKKRIE